MANVETNGMVPTQDCLPLRIGVPGQQSLEHCLAGFVYGPDGSLGLRAEDVQLVAGRLVAGGMLWIPVDALPGSQRLAEPQELSAVRQIAGEATYIDTESRKLVVSGEEVEATHREFELLRYITTQPGRVLDRPNIYRNAWGGEIVGEGHARTIDVHVRRVRVKLGCYRKAIHTVRGVGYRFDPLDA